MKSLILTIQKCNDLKNELKFFCDLANTLFIDMHLDTIYSISHLFSPRDNYKNDVIGVIISTNLLYVVWVLSFVSCL